MKLIVAVIRPFLIDKLVVALEDPRHDRLGIAGIGQRLKTSFDAIDPFEPNKRVEIFKATIRLFTPAGDPTESNYRTLKTVYEHLGVSYGRYNEDGFVTHDLRHNFGTEIMRGSDIETARELLGHSNISQTGTCVHTSPERLRAAVRNRENIDYDANLKAIFMAVKMRDWICKILTLKFDNYSVFENRTVKKWSKSF
jgi:integrase